MPSVVLKFSVSGPFMFWILTTHAKKESHRNYFQLIQVYFAMIKAFFKFQE